FHLFWQHHVVILQYFHIGLHRYVSLCTLLPVKRTPLTARARVVIAPIKRRWS
ncbi:hypothetical protein X975_03375, partial [Stegodyphus mimosarum]